MWWKENLIKHQKVSKYYENDCRTQSVKYQKILKLVFGNDFLNHEKFYAWLYSLLYLTTIISVSFPILIVLSNSRSVSGMYFIIEAKSASFAGEISLSKHYLQDLRILFVHWKIELAWHFLPFFSHWPFFCLQIKTFSHVVKVWNQPDGGWLLRIVIVRPLNRILVWIGASWLGSGNLLFSFE